MRSDPGPPFRRSEWNTYAAAGQSTAQNARETGADGDLPAFRNWGNPKHIEDLATIWNVDPATIPHWAPPTHADRVCEIISEVEIRVRLMQSLNRSVSIDPHSGQLDRDLCSHSHHRLCLYARPERAPASVRGGPRAAAMSATTAIAIAAYALLLSLVKGAHLQQLHYIGLLLLNLAQCTLFRRFVRPPPQKSGSVTKPLTAEMVVTDFDHKIWT